MKLRHESSEYKYNITTTFARDKENWIFPVYKLVSILPDLQSIEGIKFAVIIQKSKEKENEGILLVDPELMILGISSSCRHVLGPEVSKWIKNNKIRLSSLSPSLAENIESLYIEQKFTFEVPRNLRELN